MRVPRFKSLLHFVRFKRRWRAAVRYTSGAERDDQEQDQGDQEQEQDDQNQDQGPPPESDEEDESQDGEPQPAPGDMTREEAERLLQAVQEDPDDVNRRQAPLRGRRPRKPW